MHLVSSEGSFEDLMNNSSMLSTIYGSPQTAIAFSQLANKTSMTYMPSTNDTENMFWEILLAPCIAHFKDNEIASKHSQD